MTVGTGPASARRDERGVTLIELLVTIAVLALGFVAVLTAFAQTETQVGSTTDDAQLVSRARAISDYIQSKQLVYVQCAVPLSYQTPLRSSGEMSSVDRVVDVEQATSSGSGLTIAGTLTPLTPVNTCTSSGGPTDYGVQRITFEVISATGRTLTRVVYKRWN